MILVCPKCGYGFAGEKAERLRCPRADCNHEWTVSSEDEYTVYTPGRRRAEHYLRAPTPEGDRELLPLQQETFRIGRASSNDLVLTDLKVSREHCSLRRSGEFYSVRDHNSAHGTRVNGREVQEQRLLSGDCVQVGDFELEYLIRFSPVQQAAPESPLALSVQDRGGLSDKLVLRQGEETTDVVKLARERVSIGRGADNDILIDSPSVSRKHALLTRERDGVYLLDLKSTNGTFVNNEPVIRRKLERGDRIHIGPVLLLFEGESLRRQTSTGNLDLLAVGVNQEAGGQTILRDINLAIFPNEFVGVLGPSGAGKSTLMDALNGFRPAVHGRVLLNGEDLYENYDRFRNQIGYVPQADIIHHELTAYRALYYTAKLRMPPDVTRAEIDRIIDEVLDVLELDDRRNVRIRDLSGGQRKRVSLGVELLTKPSLLFLDEPTSGLDPGTEARMMALFRKLADQGRTVVLTTHVMQHIHLMDHIAVLDRGRLVYYGPPREALKHFELPNIHALYDRLQERSPEDWESKFRRSPWFTEFLRRRLQSQPPRAAPETGPRRRIRFTLKNPLLLQFLTLSRRYFDIVLADRRNVMILMAQAPIIALLIAMVFETNTPFALGMKIFLLGISAIWFGCINSARELVKEHAVYARERMVNLRLVPYVFSKLAVLSVLCVLQAFILLWVVDQWETLQGDFLWQLGFLVATSLGAMSIGLCVSAAVSSPDKAVGIIPIILIPQIIFAGAIVRLQGGLDRVGRLMVAYWSYDGFMETLIHRRQDVLALNMGVLVAFVALYTLFIFWFLKQKEKR